MSRRAHDLPLPHPRLPRLALVLYPASWRDRYGDEVLALLAEAGGGARAAASLAWHAVPAWICPPRHLHADRDARMRASLRTVLLAWSVLAGLSLAFAQLTQFQGAIRPGLIHVAASGHRVLYLNSVSYPSIIIWSYRVFDAALGLSALAIGIGGLPLWLVMVRRARREYRARDLRCLLLPVLVPACYLIGLLAAVRLIHRPEGVGPWWFLAFFLAGLAAAIGAATGPGIALRRMRPSGLAVSFASRTAAVGVGGMLVAVVASSTAAIVLYSLATPVPVSVLASATSTLQAQLRAAQQLHNVPALVLYLTLAAAAVAIAAVSAGRGARAALAAPR